MKLWLCNATSTDYDNYGLVVEETEEKAKRKFAERLDENSVWHAGVWVEEVTEVDGYEVIVREKRSFAKGTNYFN